MKLSQILSKRLSKRLSKYRLLTLALMSLVVVTASTSTAHANYEYWEDSNHYSSNSPVQIDIVDDRGRTMNQHNANSRKQGVQRAYLEAHKGKNYQLRLRNTSNRRVGVVIAVDGRNILTGKKSWLSKNEKMYILDPHETSNYKGWRTNKNHVNRFYFTSAGNSYAEAWSDRSAMGVIAVAVFNEIPQHPYYNKHKKYSPNAKGKGAMGKSRRGYLNNESTGTGFGHEEHSPTVRVSFKAENKPVAKHFLKYEWRNTLCKRGIIECGDYQNNRSHNRFWPRETNNGYAPYPPGHYKYNNQHKKPRWSEQFSKRWDTQYNRGW